MKKLLQIVVLLFSSHLLYSQTLPSCPASDEELLLEYRIVNFRYDPDYDFTGEFDDPEYAPSYSTNGAIIFDLELKAGANYSNKIPMNQTNIKMWLGDYTGFVVDWGGPFPPAENTYLYSYKLIDNPRNNINATGSRFSPWWFPMIPIPDPSVDPPTGVFMDIDRFLNTFDPYYKDITDQFQYAGTGVFPILSGTPTSNFSLKLEHACDHQGSNWSGFCGLGFMVQSCYSPSCPEYFYLDTDPYATANLGSDTLRMLCINSISNINFPDIINSNNTDPVDNQFFGLPIPGVWYNGTDTVSTIKTENVGTTIYTFHPGPHYNGYCNLDVQMKVIVTDPDNINNIGVLDACAGQPFDLTEGIDISPSEIGNYKFYICETGDCSAGPKELIVDPTQVIQPTPDSYTNYYFVQYSTSACEGTAFPISVDVHTTPATPDITPICSVNGLITGMTINTQTGADFTYSINGTDYYSATIFQNLSFGALGYTVSVKHTDGCEVSADFSCHICDPIAIGTIQAEIQPGCNNNNGAIQFYVSGGSGNYQYIVSHEPTIVHEYTTTTGLIEQLPAGTYTLKVWDKIYPQCDTAVSHQITLYQDASDLFIQVVAEDVIDCTETDGVLYIEVSGGKSPYSYTIVGTSNPIIGNMITGLGAGEYEIIVKDDDGCVTSSGIVRINSLKDVEDFDISLDNWMPTPCGASDGKATFTITGNLPYKYQLNYHPAISALTATEEIEFEDLNAGTHILRVFSDCGEKFYPFTIPNSGADSLRFTVDVYHVLHYCDDVEEGKLALNISGGNPAYSYSINDAAPVPYTAPIPVWEGTYYIRVYDNDNCYFEVNDVTVERVNAVIPVSIGSVFATIDPACSGGTGGEIQFYISGGSGNYEYIVSHDPTTIRTYTDGKISGLSAGNYRIWAWDSTHPCDTAMSQDFVLDNAGTTLFFDVVPVDAEDCTSQSGYLNIFIIDGTPDTYTLYDASGNPISSSTSPPTDDRYNVEAGVYVVEITDDAGCVISSGEVRVSAPPSESGLLFSELSSIPTTCGESTGMVRFAIDGDSPYYYQLNSTEEVLAMPKDTVVLSGLPAGSHILRVYNSCGELIEPFIITNSTGNLSFTTEKQNVLIDCDGNITDGYIALNVTGGNPTYKYTYTGADGWNYFTTTTSIDTIWDLKTGIYLIEVIDTASGCTYAMNEIKIVRETQCKIALDLKLFLQGVTQFPEDGPPFMTNLIQVKKYPTQMPGLALPTTNPFFPAVQGTYMDINNVDGVAGEVVDWILVEIWTDFALNTANNIYTDYTLLAEKALLLKTDGTVVDTNGRVARFDSYPLNNVRIVVRPRNHLSVMSQEVPFTSSFSYDFSTGIDKALQAPSSANFPMVMMTSKTNSSYSVPCLWAGDLDRNEWIENMDATMCRYATQSANILGIYHPADVNMDGFFDYFDDLFVLYNTKLSLYSPVYYFIKRP